MTTRRYAFALLLGLLPIADSTLVAARAADDLSGLYRMEGRGFGPADAPYAGTCTLKRAGAAYDVSCFNRDTRHTYTGRGLAAGDTLAIYIGDTLRGDHNSTVRVEYLVVYRRRADGALEGTWLEAQGGAAGREVLTPVR